MSKILTQEEIDALLSSVSNKPEAEPAPRAKKASEIQLYDFKHPDKISKDQMRTLRTLHDNFARMFSPYLSTNLRSMVDVNLLSIDQVTFSEYSLSLSIPNALYVLKSAQLEGKALLEISPQFLLFVVDRLLGGIGDVDVRPREISQIERNVVDRVVETIVRQLNDVWRQVHPLDLEIESFESDPQFIQIARSSDTLAIIFFDIRVRNATFTMNLGFPYFTLEPIMNRLSPQSMMALTGRKPKEKEDVLIRERLQASKLPVRAVLADTTLAVRDFINLEKDDLLQIDKRTGEPVALEIGGRMKFFGTPGKAGRRKAIKLIRPVSPDEELIYE